MNKHFDTVVAHVRKGIPEFEGALTVDESIRDQLALISRVSIVASGSFVHRNGKDATGGI